MRKMYNLRFRKRIIIELVEEICSLELAAFSLGISEKTISRWLSGEEVPSDTSCRLALAVKTGIKVENINLKKVAALESALHDAIIILENEIIANPKKHEEFQKLEYWKLLLGWGDFN